MAIVAKKSGPSFAGPPYCINAIRCRTGLTETVNVLGEARFVSRGCIFMNDALVDRFIDQRDCWIEELNAPIFVACGDGGAQFLYRSAQLTAVAAVDLVAFCVLTNAFHC